MFKMGYMDNLLAAIMSRSQILTGGGTKIKVPQNVFTHILALDFKSDEIFELEKI